MKQVFIVEDDINLSEGICLALNSSEINVVQSHSLNEARKAIAFAQPNLVLLDINLPDGNGLELLKEIKTISNTPVILLTANDTEMDVVMGLEHGADDYITKPFSLAILRARVNAQLRRAGESLGNIVIINPYVFDFKRMLFSRDGKAVDLSKTEQKLLRLLVENRGHTLPRDVLLDRVWGGGMDFVDENTLSVAIKRLRDKLGAADWIKTVYGIGYLWMVE